MTAFHYYKKIKNKVCLIYEGNTPEYLIQLKMLRRSWESKYPNVSLTYACRNQYLHYLTGDKQTISLDKYDSVEYGLSIPVVYNAQTEKHPILSLIEGLPIQNYPTNKSVSYNGIICPEGNYPTGSLTEKQINNLKNWLVNHRMKPIVVGTSLNETKLPVEQRPSPQQRSLIARTAGFVVGVECDIFYQAIEAGVPTALVSPSKGLYELLCSKPIILNI